MSIENSNLGFKIILTPIFNDKYLTVDVNSFLQQVASAIKELKPYSACLNKTYQFDGEQFNLIQRINSQTTRDETGFLQLLKGNTDVAQVEFTLILSIPMLNSNQFMSFMKHICSKTNRYDINWNFENGPPSTQYLSFTRLFKEKVMEKFKLNVVSFAFGNMVNVNRFAVRLEESITKGCPRSSFISTVSIDPKENLKQLVVLFKLHYFDPEDKPLSKSFKLTFDFTSIAEIIMSTVDDDIEFYLYLLYPPKLFVKVGAAWDRWGDCNNIISREIIGKSSTFMFRVKTGPRSRLPDIITKVSTVFINMSVHQILTQPMEKHCMKGDSSSLYEHFPSDIKYALHCIDSLTFSFFDDLKINGTHELFNILIGNCIKGGKEAAIVKTLHQIFVQYLKSGILNVIVTFTDSLKVNLTNDQYPVDDGGSDGDDNTNCLKRFILTPLRTIYLPPMPTIENFDDKIFIGIREELNLQSLACFQAETEIIDEDDFDHLTENGKSKEYFRQVIDKLRTRPNHYLNFSFIFNEYDQLTCYLFEYGVCHFRPI